MFVNLRITFVSSSTPFPLCLFCHPWQCLLLILLFGFFINELDPQIPADPRRKVWRNWIVMMRDGVDTARRGHKCNMLWHFSQTIAPRSFCLLLIVEGDINECSHCQRKKCSNIALHVWIWIYHQLQQCQAAAAANQQQILKSKAEWEWGSWVAPLSFNWSPTLNQIGF